jgi:hypothetical protein
MYDEAIFLECIDRGLDAFGQNTSKVAYFQLNAWKKLKREDIPSHLGDFQNFLVFFFKARSSLIEETIVKEILRNFDIPVSATKDLKLALVLVQKHPTIPKKIQAVAAPAPVPVPIKAVNPTRKRKELKAPTPTETPPSLAPQPTLIETPELKAPDPEALALSELEGIQKMESALSAIEGILQEARDKGLMEASNDDSPAFDVIEAGSL